MSKKVSKKVFIIEEDEMWFPEELWSIIKSFAGIGMEKKCSSMTYHTRSVCNSVGLYCFPSIIFEYKYDEDTQVFNPEKFKCVVEKKWYCEDCASNASHQCYNENIQNVSLHGFREVAIKNKAYNKPGKVANTVGGYLAGDKAVTALKKRLRTTSVKDNIAELATYWKDYCVFAINKRKEYIIDNIDTKNRTIIGKANKEQFGREIALMLVENKISYEVFQRIMAMSISHCVGGYVDGDFRAKYGRYGNAENNYQLPI
jgi:hypothetical protein